MGFRLVADSLGLIATAKISHGARVALLSMSFHAKDSTGRYWKGHEVLALALGYTDPGSPPAVRAVTRHVRELLTAGIVEVEREAQPGRTRVYRFPHVPEPEPVEDL